MSVQSTTLLTALPELEVRGEVPRAIESVAIDSRVTTPGSLFVALRGEHVDGHAFAAAAVERGAALLVVERPLPLAVPQVIVADTHRALSRLADAFYGHPSQAMRVVGITGTNGKTTTTFLVQAICTAAGLPCGTIGTLGAAFNERLWPLENTTPLALDLHRVLAEMAQAGARAVAMEVSSHALALHRADDVHFAAAAFTNLTHDHLDFHGTVEAYAAAKRRLFDLTEHAVLNLDDATGRALAAELPTALTYALDASADLCATDVVLGRDGSSFRVDGMPIEVRLPGRFNVSNALAAIGIGRVLGFDDATIARGIASLDAVPGRMERIEHAGIVAIVDYAHTPDALTNVLTAVREMTPGRLVVVFGCGGDRDREKRPEMGWIASHYADRTIVTSDNPRGEDAAEIARAVVGDTRAEIELDRRAAIRAAIASARPGDTVLVAGKGHESEQIEGTHRRPFDDRAEVRAAFALLDEVASS